MTERLTPSSPRFAAAVRFGELLSRRMAELEVGQGVVKDAAKVSRASVVEFRNGRNLPTLEVALRIAEALNEPRLAQIVREARTGACIRCGRAVLNEQGFPKKYCSAACRMLFAGERRRRDGGEAVQILRGELLRVGPVRKQRVGHALTLIDDAAAPERDALAAVDAYQASVVAMCGWCEPDGLCRTPECPLRGVSPLPLVTNDVDVETARKPPGLWGTPGMREHMAEKMRRRHAAGDPGLRRGLEAMLDPEVRKRAVAASVAASKARSPEDRGRAARKAWQTRRARAAA